MVRLGIVSVENKKIAFVKDAPLRRYRLLQSAKTLGTEHGYCSSFERYQRQTENLVMISVELDAKDVQSVSPHTSASMMKLANRNNHASLPVSAGASENS